MIIKFYELKNKINQYKFFLLYGNNTGLIEETIENVLKPNLSKNILNYEESEIINNSENFKEELLNKSFFDNEKLIIISRVSDKIFNILDDILNKKIDDISFILISGALEKKSKIRSLFEKSNYTACVPFYEDTNETLSTIFKNFLIKSNIKISQEKLNLIIQRFNGNRINLKNELQKIENLLITKKNIKFEDLLNITNLAENHSHSELVDNSLIGNKKKTLNIINENNFSSEDCVLILRIFLQKLKRLLRLKNQNERIQNIDKTISSFKPPIFWKEKETVKKQIEIWETNKIEDLISETCDTEYAVKKNPNISVKVLTNFILDRISVQ